MVCMMLNNTVHVIATTIIFIYAFAEKVIIHYKFVVNHGLGNGVDST